MKHRVLGLISVLLLASGLLISCGDSTAPPSDTTQSDDTVATEAITETPETEYRYTPVHTDYKNAEFRIINFDSVTNSGWFGTPSDLFPAEDPYGDILSEAVFARNLRVEEQMKIKIVGQELIEAELSSAVSKANLSGDAEFDAVFCGIYQMAGFVSN